MFCIPMKSNCMLSPSPSGPPKNAFWSLYGKVDLAEQDGVPDPAGDEVADVAEVLVGVERAGLARHGVPGEQERHGVDPEAGDPELEPEAERA